MPFRPARVLHQDYTGAAALADLASLRDAVREAGGDPSLVDPVARTDFVVDHSLRVDVAGHVGAAARNLELELERNRERYELIAWATGAFERLRVVPPGVGIVHQVNLEVLAEVATVDDGRARLDSMVGTDSHSTMVGALGVLGWGVGGIEAEAAMLGQPLPVTLPPTVRVVLEGALGGPAGGVRRGAGARRPAAGRGAGRRAASRWVDLPWPGCRWPTGPRSPTWPRSTG